MKGESATTKRAWTLAPGGSDPKAVRALVQGGAQRAIAKPAQVPELLFSGSKRLALEWLEHKGYYKTPATYRIEDLDE